MAEIHGHKFYEEQDVLEMSDRQDGLNEFQRSETCRYIETCRYG